MLNLIQQRNNDLMNAIRREMASASSDTPFREILRRAVDGPAPRFYVSFDRALKAIGQALSGVRPCAQQRRYGQWAELTARVAVLLRNTPLPLSAAVARVLTTAEAPSFYISVARALTIYHEQTRLTKALRSSRRSDDCGSLRA